MFTNKIFSKLTVLVSVALSCVIFACALTGCGGGDVEKLEAEVYDFYDVGEQTVVLNLTDSATFKSSISVSDIEFVGVLVGRTATKVEYVTEKQIKLTLGGKCSTSELSTETAIIVKANAISNSKNYRCSIITVEAAGLKFVTNSFGGALGGKCNFSETFKLTSGHFNAENITTDNITLLNPTADATISVSVSADKKQVTIDVDGFDTAGNNAPQIQFASNVSDLDRVFTETLLAFSL